MQGTKKSKIMNWVKFFSIVEEKEVMISEFSFASKKKAFEFFNENFGQCIIDDIYPRIHLKCGCVITRVFSKEDGELEDRVLHNCNGH